MKKSLLLITLLLTFFPIIDSSVEAADPNDPNIVSVQIKITPQTLNLKSNGKWVTCLIELPEDYNVFDVLTDSILLEYSVESSWQWFDVNEQILMAKFDHTRLQCDLVPTDAVELIVTGELADGNGLRGGHSLSNAID